MCQRCQAALNAIAASPDVSNSYGARRRHVLKRRGRKLWLSAPSFLDKWAGLSMKGMKVVAFIPFICGLLGEEGALAGLHGAIFGSRSASASTGQRRFAKYFESSLQIAAIAPIPKTRSSAAAPVGCSPSISNGNCMTKKFSRLALALILVGLGACSREPVTFVATSTLENSPPRLKASLKLNGFRPDVSGGDGTLTVEREPGSHTTTPEGAYPVKWQWIANDSSFVVSIPEVHAGLRFDLRRCQGMSRVPPRPSGAWNASVISQASAIWCGCRAYSRKEVRHGSAASALPGRRRWNSVRDFSRVELPRGHTRSVYVSREEKLVCEVVRDLTNELGIDVEPFVQPVRVIGAEEGAAQLAAGEIHNRPVGHVRRC